MSRLFFRPDNGSFSDALHGLRGIAVLIVLLSHLGNSGLYLAPVPHNGIGKVGVWIFFVLSAYLLTSRLLTALEREARSRSAEIKSYFIRRFFRIYPLFLAVLLLHAALGSLSASQVAGHLLLMQGWEELWAIPVEFQYYFFIPLICLAAHRYSRRLAGGALLAALLLSFAYNLAHPDLVISNSVVLLHKLAPFLLGSLLGLMLSAPGGRRGVEAPSTISTAGGSQKLSVSVGQQGSQEPSSRSLAGDLHSDQPPPWLTHITGLLGVAGLAALIVVYRQTALGAWPIAVAPWYSLGLGLASCCLVHAALQPGWLNRLLSLKALVFVGEVSFSLYLLHMLAIRIIGTAGIGSPTTQAWSATLLALIFAWLSYLLIEKPGMRLGRKLS